MENGKWEVENGATLLARSCGWMVVDGGWKGGRGEGGYIIDIDFYVRLGECVCE